MTAQSLRIMDPLVGLDRQSTLAQPVGQVRLSLIRAADSRALLSDTPVGLIQTSFGPPTGNCLYPAQDGDLDRVTPGGESGRMEFASPRFQVFPWLWEILNDSDPGTKKLESGDHSEDVRVVQRALFDLGWTMRVDPQFTEREAFADSWFGDDTYGVALAFKSHYGIQYTGAGPGEYSGNVGPQTLAKLDHQCMLYDASYMRILEKARILDHGTGVLLVHDGPGPQPDTILGTSGVYWPVTYLGEYGHFCDEESTGTFVVQGAIYAHWADEGWATGPLGFPTSDVVDLEDGTYLADFVGGRITLDAKGYTSVEYWT